MLDINLRHLEVFAAVTEYNSFTKAAEALYLSQSTVSAHIQSLEKALGVTLFHRVARKKIELTEEGRRIYGIVLDILDRCRLLQTPSCAPGWQGLWEAAEPPTCRQPGLRTQARGGRRLSRISSASTSLWRESRPAHNKSCADR